MVFREIGSTRSDAVLVSVVCAALGDPSFRISVVRLDIEEVIPEEILDRRLSKKGNQAHLQVLIKWSSLPASSATWEDHDVVKTRFPDAPAWGLDLKGEEV